LASFFLARKGKETEINAITHHLLLPLADELEVELETVLERREYSDDVGLQMG